MQKKHTHTVYGLTTTNGLNGNEIAVKSVAKCSSVHKQFYPSIIFLRKLKRSLE
jgi:hypothetical protein